MTKFAVAAFAMALQAGAALAGDGQPPPAKELVQYVVDATRQGVKAPEIKKNAVAIGWPVAEVDEAIAYASKPQPRKAEPTAAAAVRPENTAAGRESATTAPPATETTVPAIKTVPSAAAEAIKNRGVPDDYRIGAGDVLQISVWKEPDASVPSVVVRPDGKVSMPLLKQIEVAGLTPTELEHSITEKLSQFINVPDVTVVVTQINSKKVYVVGAARREGPLTYTYRMTVMQALSEAGGLNDYAKRKKIYVLRTENGKDYQLAFNYDEVIRGEKTEQNIQLLPGDTIIIPH